MVIQVKQPIRSSRLSMLRHVPASTQWRPQPQMMATSPRLKCMIKTATWVALNKRSMALCTRSGLPSKTLNMASEPNTGHGVVSQNKLNTETVKRMAMTSSGFLARLRVTTVTAMVLNLTFAMPRRTTLKMSMSILIGLTLLQPSEQAPRDSIETWFFPKLLLNLYLTS